LAIYHLNHNNTTHLREKSYQFSSWAIFSALVTLLQQGNHQVHVSGPNHVLFGDLRQIQSHFSMKLNFYHLDNLMIKLQEFVVTKKPKISQVKECVLSNSEELLSIWNENPNLFFGPQLQFENHQLSQSQDYQWIQKCVAQCSTTLKYQKIRALRFLWKNKLNQDTIAQI
ncbi:hypothetical protein VP01_5455g1, partial [Puccinia sorghi]